MLFKKKTQENVIDKKEITAQDFVNVVDIKDKFLYTRDKYIISFIQVPSIDVHLLSQREKVNKANILTAEFSAVNKIFKFLAISRPVDIAPLLADYNSIYSETSNLKQKELLRHEMTSISNFALSGEIVERQFFIVLWEIYERGIEADLNKRAMEMVSMFEAAGIKAEILRDKGIIRLCNLINNPAFVNLEDMDINQTIPFIFSQEVVI